MEHARRVDPALAVKPTAEEIAAKAAAVQAEAKAAAASAALALVRESEYNAGALVRKNELALLSAAACAAAQTAAAEEAAETAIAQAAERRVAKAAHVALSPPLLPFL